MAALTAECNRMHIDIGLAFKIAMVELYVTTVGASSLLTISELFPKRLLCLAFAFVGEPTPGVTNPLHRFDGTSLTFTNYSPCGATLSGYGKRGLTEDHSREGASRARCAGSAATGIQSASSGIS